MKFNEAMKELIAGKRVRNTVWPDGTYIFIKGTTGDVLAKTTYGVIKPYVFNKSSMTGDWEYHPIKEGTLLNSDGGDSYRVVLNSRGDYDVLSLTSWVALGAVETQGELDELAHKHHLEVVSE